MTKLYFEDMTPDRRFSSGPYTMTLDEIRAFAGQYDPQPFHLDEEAAKKTFFGGLVASGWHTAAVTMRLMATGDMQMAGGALGAGIEQLQWPKPVRPGDTLRIETETVEKRESKSRPDRGIVKFRTTTYNQAGEAVQILVGNMIVPKRG